MRTRGLFVIGVMVWAPLTFGATFVVDSTVDAVDANPGDGVCATTDGACTLRAATMEANALEGEDTIEVPAGFYALTVDGDVIKDPFDVTPEEGDLDILDDTVIMGAGADTTIIDASQIADRVLSSLGERYTPDPLEVSLKGLTLTGGSTTSGGGCVLHYGNGTLTLEDSVVTGCEAPNEGGGGIAHWGFGQVGKVVLIDSTVSDNRASWGGGIDEINGDLELIRSTVTRNTAIGPYPGNAQWGGGVHVPVGSLTAIDSVISDNVAGRAGGGIYAADSQIYLERTTVSGNRALHVYPQDAPWDGRGGGIWIERVWFTILNSTISGNEAAVQGGGIYSYREGSFQIAFSTIAANRALTSLPGAGLTMESPSDRPTPWFQGLRGTIIAGNFADGVLSNCAFAKTVESRGFNIGSDDSCGLGDATDLSGVDAGLASLAANGGTGLTHALLEGSPAVDFVPAEECIFALDNDGDSKVDEDPVDGLDNDDDYRLDEDPVDVVEVDQRGVPRPLGSACDAGAHEGTVEQATEELINQLIVDVEELIGDGEINYGRGRSLIAELQVALWFLQFNNGERIAIIRIELFIKKVEILVNKGDLEPELGDELLVKARAVLEMLKAASS